MSNFNKIKSFLVLFSIAIVFCQSSNQVLASLTANGNNEDSSNSKNSELKNADLIVDEKFDLNDEILGNIMKDFGKEINDMMTNEVDKLVEDVKTENKNNNNNNVFTNNKNNNLDSSSSLINKNTSDEKRQAELERFKNANKVLSKNTQQRIEMVGKKNEGELTQSGLMGDGDANKSLLQQVNSKLQLVGTFIGHQMSSLNGLAPKLSGKIRKIPMQLRKLMHWPTFLKFKIKFNKVYKSLREELYRQIIYLRTQTIVGIQNLKYLCGKVKHLLKATQFADWTELEFKNVYNNLQAETDLTTPDIKSITFEQKEKLNELAKNKQTIFGLAAPEAGPTAKDLSDNEDENENNDSKKEKRRKKREYNELDDEEEDEDVNHNLIVKSLKSNDNDDDDDEFKDAQDHFSSDSEDDDDDDDFLKNELGNDDNDNQNDDSKIVDQFSAQFDDDAGSIDDSLEDIIDSALDEATNESSGSRFEPIDLRKTGCVLEPENQDICGACYAYVTMSAASYYNCINSSTKQVERYNARFLSDCGRYISPLTDERPKINGCHGGRVSHALKFVDSVGAYEFMDYEFARRGHSFSDDKCIFQRPDSIENWIPMKNIPPTKVQSYHNVYYASLQLDEVDLHLRTVGPVFVNIRVWEGFKDYASGIVDSFKEAPTSVIHSMLIVGHDFDAHGKDYYIIWNSHGTSWGENGFARVYAKSLDYFKVYIGGLMPNEE